MREAFQKLMFAAVLSGGCIASPTLAQQSEPIASALMQLTQRELGSTPVRATEWKPADFLKVRRAKPAVMLRPSFALKITFSLPAFGNSDQIVPVFNDLLSTIKAACTSSGGVLEVDTETLPSSDHAVRKALAQLREVSPFGQHTCLEGEKTRFLIQISAAAAAQGSLIPGASYTWNVFLNVINGDVFSRLESRIAAAGLEAEKFRETLAVSSMVAIAARDLPQSARPTIPKNWAGMGFFEANDYRVCAMVIQIQGPLLQVQVGTQSIFVKRDSVWPFRKSVGFGSSMKGDWENWCIGE